jgi:uncharacterized membrane protein
VTLIPFSTSVLGTFVTLRPALLLYWFNIFLFGVAVMASWFYAKRAGLTRRGIEPDFHRAFVLRVCISQSFYAVATLLCFVFNTYVSIAFIVFVQLNYALAPKLMIRRH